MTRRPRRWPWWVLGILAVIAAPVLWFLPPVYPYRVACGDFMDRPVDAPLRPVFIRLLRKGLDRDAVPYFTVFGRPYLTWLGSFDSLNWEKGYAFRIASGQSDEATPNAIIRLVAAWEAKTGTRLARYENGQVQYREFEKLNECSVKRAALTFADGD